VIKSRRLKLAGHTESMQGRWNSYNIFIWKMCWKETSWELKVGFSCMDTDFIYGDNEPLGAITIGKFLNS
jgi:hypothetical protein